jgi:GH25 family lysozyme M1 (1,4-beta-N-acetylmuramidase)
MQKLFFLFCLVLLSCSGKKEQTTQQSTKQVFINGVDISHHNKVQWDSLKTCNLDFVYIKASEGKSYKDPKRIENYKIAKKYYSVGFYVFWKKEVSGKEHYKNFKEATKSCPTNLPPVLDLEDRVRDKATLLKTIKEVEIFSNLYMKEYKVRPIIYTWYDVAINIHTLNPTYKYWLNIGSRNVRNPHKPISIPNYNKVPWVILQCGKWNFNKGYIDLNYGIGQKNK